MGRQFDPTSPDYLAATTAAVTGVPATFSAWIQLDTTSLGQRIVVCGISGVAGDTLSLFWGTGAGGQLEVNHYDGSSATATQPLLDADAVNLHHVCGVFSSVSSRTAYVDGVAGTEQTSVQDAVAGLNYTDIGDTDWDTGRIQGFDGMIAEVGIWDVALSDEEVFSLGPAVRKSPELVRPENLVWYKSLRFPDFNRESTGRLAKHRLVNGGSTFTGNHPPGIVYPRKRLVIPGEQVVAAGGLSIPVAYHHYQRNIG